MRPKVIVAMSGGVDSSVVAYLLKKRGYDVKGVFMRNWHNTEDKHCSIKRDIVDVIAVAEILDIEIEIIDFSKEYYEEVFSDFIAEYKAYRTPNPDVFCNSKIKFKVFLEYAQSCGADYMATGHYVAKKQQGEHQLLLKAKDSNKDQSYFLYRLNQQQLQFSLFPLANFCKPEIRAIAQQIGLPNANKKDSVGICFVGNHRKFRKFLSQYLSDEPGDICCINTGKILGNHYGLSYYTIGQRQGLNINNGPWFVVQKNIKDNILLVANGHNNPSLYSSKLTAKNLSFINQNHLINNHKYQGRIRYRMEATDCVVNYIDNDTINVTFDYPQFAVTAGQSVVIYDNDICLGGGIIE